MIPRFLKEQIVEAYRRKKVIVIFGSRQVGKSTLLEELTASDSNVMLINSDNLDERQLLINKSSSELKELIAPFDYFLIDEAQRIADIGLILKKIGDLKLDTKVIVTGSSALDLAGKINEPATGRLIEYKLFPLSLAELASTSSRLEQNRLLPQRMIYGLYPEVVTQPQYARDTLLNLANNFLYKDILSYRGIKKPDILSKLVQALALQIGSEVSYNELSNMLGIDKITVENYITLLEKCFILFRLNSYSRNQRNEIKKGKKVYFYDNGIRNAVIANFAPIDMRNDVGQLWENLMVSERIKRNAYCRSYAQLYFWRNHDQREIDLIEIADGNIATFEFKWDSRRQASMPAAFASSYPGASYTVISRDNYWPFISN